MMIYPGYKADDVLNEPVNRFVVLLKRGIELTASEDLKKSTISSLPYMDKLKQKEFIRSLKSQLDTEKHDTIEDIRKDRLQLKKILKNK